MCIYDMYMFQYEGDLSELEAKLDSSKERVNKINQEMRPIEVGVISKVSSFKFFLVFSRYQKSHGMRFPTNWHFDKCRLE